MMFHMEQDETPVFEPGDVVLVGGRLGYVIKMAAAMPVYDEDAEDVVVCFFNNESGTFDARDVELR